MYLKGFIPVFSVYGASFILAIIAAMLLVLLEKNSFKTKLYILLGLGIILISNSLLASHHQNATLKGKAQKVALIQGNIAENIKWQPGQIQNTLEHYLKLSRDHWKNTLVVWPENTISYPKSQVMPILHQLDNLAKQENAGLIVGLPIDHGSKFYNGAQAQGNAKGDYLKQKLVMFGEYIPFESLIGPALAKLALPSSSFQQGPSKQKLITMEHHPIAVFICYESAFAHFMQKNLQNAQLIVIISDDNWFGSSIGLDQHMQMAQLRALELHRPILNATNSGITAIINPYGEIIKQAPAQQASVLQGRVHFQSQPTLFSQYGFIPLSLLLLLLWFGYVCGAIIHRKISKGTLIT